MAVTTEEKSFCEADTFWSGMREHTEEGVDEIAEDTMRRRKKRHTLKKKTIGREKRETKSALSLCVSKGREKLAASTTGRESGIFDDPGKVKKKKALISGWIGCKKILGEKGEEEGIDLQQSTEGEEKVMPKMSKQHKKLTGEEYSLREGENLTSGEKGRGFLC